jgi:hypothetical protein
MSTVQRIRTDHGSHVEPPFDESWSDLEKLRWKTAIAELDGGLGVGTLKVSEAPQEERKKRFVMSYRYPVFYQLSYGYGSMGIYTYDQMWVLLTGVLLGASLSGKVPT